MEHSMVENPDDLNAYLAYSDWLLEQGDPRGELIAVQVALLRQPSSQEMKEREAALFEKYGDLWLGPLSRHRAKKVTWRLGFLDQVEIHKGPGKGMVCSQLLSQILQSPVGRLIRKMTLDLEYGWEEKDDGMITNAIATARPALLSDVTLRAHPFLLRNLGALWSSVPKLTHFAHEEKWSMSPYRIDSERPLDLGKVAAPSLRHLAICTFSPVHEWSESIVDADVPGLESLLIDLGGARHFESGQLELDFAALRRILDVTHLGKLKHFGLRGCMIIDELCSVLGSSKLLPQLETLDLSANHMTTEGALGLSCSARAFGHLRQLDLEYNHIDEEGCELVRDVCGTVLIGRQADQEGGP
jgi:uncharacterized protein (TIGR02996 family)